MKRLRFAGRIAGFGTRMGTRIVVGRWDDSPFGAFTDVMLEDAIGHRVLVAPSTRVADFVGATYTFDEVRVLPVATTDDGVDPTSGAHDGQPMPGRGIPSVPTWHVRAEGLEVDLTPGRRTPLGHALRVVPAPLATAAWWTLVTDPVARVLLRGVRTRGSAGAGRTEYYGATDVRTVSDARARVDGQDLGHLAPVAPPPAFGFSSTPPRPSVTTLVTTIDVPESDLT